MVAFWTNKAKVSERVMSAKIYIRSLRGCLDARREDLFSSWPVFLSVVPREDFCSWPLSERQAQENQDPSTFYAKWITGWRDGSLLQG